MTLRRKGVKWKVNNIFESQSYDQYFTKHRSNLFFTQNDDMFHFIVTLFAAASSPIYDAIRWEPNDKEWITVNYQLLSKCEIERRQFYLNVSRLDFQRIFYDEKTSGYIMSYFHPDFNYNYKLEISRISNRRDKYMPKKQYPLDPVIDLTKVWSEMYSGWF